MLINMWRHTKNFSDPNRPVRLYYTSVGVSFVCEGEALWAYETCAGRGGTLSLYTSYPADDMYAPGSFS